MLLSSQHLITNPHSHSPIFFSPHQFKNPSQSLHFHPLKFQPFTLNPLKIKPFRTPHLPPLHSFHSNDLLTERQVPDQFNFDAFLSVAEFVCLSSSAVISIGYAVNSSWSRPVFGWLGNRVVVWQFVFLVGGVWIGAVIRSRQWKRFCVGYSKDGYSSSSGVGVNLLERIEKLEEDLRSSTTILRVLSRQLEKLGIRFRVTRKAMKGPIDEAAALAQKNSEATRALAMQGDILENELGEIQNVLLAMQDQQAKQLELIIAIGKAAKLWEDNGLTNKAKNKSETNNSSVQGGVKQMADNPIQALAREKEINTDGVAI